MTRRAVPILVLAATLLAIPTLASAAGEAARPTIILRTGEHQSFDRIVFDAPRGMRYTLKRDKGSVTLTFSMAAKITLRQPDVARAKGLAVIGGADGASPLVLRFAVAPEAQVKDFMSDASVVIDITGPNAPDKPLPAAPPSPPAANKAPAPPPAAPAPVAAAAAPSPAAQPTPQTPPPAAPPVQVEKSIAAAPAKEDKVLPLPAPGNMAPAPQASPVPPVQKDGPLAVAPRPLPEPMPLATAQALRVMAAEKDPQPVLSIDPGLAVGAAIFERANAVTVLFDRKLTLPPEQIKTRPPVKADPVALPNNSGLRFSIPAGLSVRAAREGTAWKIFLTQSQTQPGVTTEFVAQPEFALGARVLLPTANPPDPIFYTDPVVGDVLLVLPLRETNAFTVERQMADFDIVPAAQGLVMKPQHEKVVARIVPDGIEVTAEGGLKLSPLRDTGAYARSTEKKGPAIKRLFNVDVWRGRGKDSFTDTRQKLMHTIIDVDENQRVLARMDLARFYFAHGMGREASSLLDFIKKGLPEIEGQADFLSLRGASRILEGDYDGGLTDLNAPALADQPEATLWRGIGVAGQRDWASAFDRFKMTFSVLDSYGEPFRSQFMVLAAEAALATDHDKDAASWIERLVQQHDPSEETSLAYLQGVLASKAGNADEAGKFWHEAASGPDRLYKIRAELALVDLGVLTKSLTPKQAVDRLEGLRFAWRGDNLEFDILRRLGGFYIDAKDYHDGLLVYGQALRLYPTSPDAPELKAEMKRMFRDVFLSSIGDKLPPLDALSLYSDFKALTPDGEDGVKVRRNLAERLVDIDLLDQAGNILLDVVKSSEKPDERAQTATRLAAVRLLDKQPAAALQALDMSQADAAPFAAALLEKRSFLRARALSELGKYNEAMAALPQQQSEKATLLRADISLRAKQWDAAAQALLSLVGQPPADGASLPETKASWLTQTALALAQGGDFDGLNRLSEAYGSAMDKTSQADMFRLLTRPDSTSQLKDIGAAGARLSEVDMFKGFLESFRKDSSGTVPSGSDAKQSQ